MLKVSRDPSSDGGDVLRVEGTLSGPWVGEVRTACAELLGRDERVVLDLLCVSFVDRAGADLLDELRADPRVAIVKASAFVAELLKRGGA